MTMKRDDVGANLFRSGWMLFSCFGRWFLCVQTAHPIVGGWDVDILKLDLGSKLVFNLVASTRFMLSMFYKD